MRVFRVLLHAITYKVTSDIGVAPIMNIVHIQGKSCNVVIGGFPYHKELLLKERIRSLANYFLKEILILKRDGNEENHCLFQYSPFDVRNIPAFWLLPCLKITNMSFLSL